MTEIQPTVTSQPPTSDILTAAKGSGITFVGTLFAYAGRFALGILLARFMGVEQYGLYSLANSAVYLVMGIALLGMDTAIVHFVPIFARRRDEKSLWGVLQIGLGVPTLVSLLGGIGLFALAQPLAKAVFHEARLVPLLRIAAFAVPFGALTSAAIAVTQGFKQMQYKVIAEDIGLTVLKLVLVALLALTGLTATKAMTAYSLAVITACLILLYLLNRLFPLSRPLHLPRDRVRQMLGFSLPVYLTRLLTIFGPNLRTMLLGVFSTVVSVGVFTVASRVNIVSRAFQGAVVVASMPIVSDLYGKREQEQLGRLYQTVTKWSLTFNLPVFLAIVLFPEALLSVFGADFATGAPALIVLAIGDLVNAGTGICGVIITMTRNPWLNTLNSIIYLVLTLTLSVLLIPGLGVMGAAIAAGVGNATINLIRLVEVFVLFRLLPYNRSFAKPIIASLVAAAAAYATAHWVFTGSGFAGAVLNISLLLATYCSVILLLGLSEEDQMVLRRLYDRLSRMAIPKRITG